MAHTATDWRGGLARLGEMALDLLFPPRCVGCGCGGSFLCTSCIEGLPRRKPPFCPCCGESTPDDSLCWRCLEAPRAFDGLRSVFLYSGAIREAVRCLKYRGLRALAPPLGRLLADYSNEAALYADAIVPVPLHRRRLRQRGYNQSLLLAREMGRLTGLPVQESLVRLRDTPQQIKMASAEERRRNVQGAFAASAGDIAGRRLLLLDDVCTTGATLEACAAPLKAAGAEVWGLTLARES